MEKRRSGEVSHAHKQTGRERASVFQAAAIEANSEDYKNEHRRYKKEEKRFTLVLP